LQDVTDEDEITVPDREDEMPRLATTLEIYAVEKLYSMVQEHKGSVTPDAFSIVLKDFNNIEVRFIVTVTI
jgi:hypothetical protein